MAALLHFCCSWVGTARKW